MLTRGRYSVSHAFTKCQLFAPRLMSVVDRTAVDFQPGKIQNTQKNTKKRQLKIQIQTMQLSCPCIVIRTQWPTVCNFQPARSICILTTSLSSSSSSSLSSSSSPSTSTSSHNFIIIAIISQHKNIRLYFKSKSLLIGATVDAF